MTVNDIYQRPNYFAGQYLLEDDFELEQKYHIDREQRHNCLLHVSGIAEGLKVTQVQEGGLKIKVSPGTAVDKQGKQIILHTERTVDLPGQKDNTLFIKYAEKKESLQEDTTDGYRRIVEEPIIDFDASERSIALAKLTVTDGKITKIDESVRQYCGLRLPGGGNSEVTLRSHGEDKPNLAVLTGSLSISGMLAVTGESTLTGNVNANGSLTVKGNTTIEQELKVKSLLLGESGNGVTLRSQRQGNQNLAVLNGSLSISETLAVIGESTLTGKVTANGSLQVAGTTQLNNTLTVKDNTTLQKDLNVSGNLKVSQAITPSPGNTETFGIMFPKDPYGGSGDAAWIRYYRRENTVEDCTLEIGIANDAQDHIALMPSGNVGIGTKTPTEKLEVTGNLKVSQAITPSPGNTETSGIMFPKDPYGGSGDAAWIRYYQRGKTGEDCTLEIGIANDAQDHIALMPNTGNVGIGTSTPTEKLEVTGNVKVTGGISCGGKIGIKSFRGRYLSNTGSEETAKFQPNLRNDEYLTLEMVCSRELKENISSLSTEEAIRTLAQLNAVKYDYKNEHAFRQNIGFIAEDMPDNLATEDRKTISPFEVIPILTKVIQEQQKTLAQIQNRLNEIK